MSKWTQNTFTVKTPASAVVSSTIATYGGWPPSDSAVIDHCGGEIWWRAQLEITDYGNSKRTIMNDGKTLYEYVTVYDAPASTKIIDQGAILAIDEDEVRIKAARSSAIGDGMLDDITILVREWER